MAKIADRTPPACASCFQAGSEKRYVDFEAAYDGPVIPGSPENQPIDDLVICEECLAEAFALLDPDGLHETIHVLETKLEAAAKSDASKDRMVERLEKTLAELVEHPVQKRGGGTQHYAGVPDDVRKQLNERRERRKRGQKSQKKAKVKANG